MEPPPPPPPPPEQTPEDEEQQIADVSMESSSVSTGFPADVIVDILSRLPLKSLIRFRCVSKPWLHLLTQSRFPYWLLNRHVSCDPPSCVNHHRPTLILQYSLPPNTLLFSIGPNDDGFKSATPIDHSPLGSNNNNFEIKSTCCDGMICLSAQNDTVLILWNPAIRDFKILPLPSESRVCAGVCGLGFDLTVDDYKVISVTDGQAFAFSVKKNIWRILGDFNYHIFYDGLAANGCLYWAAGKNNTAADRILRLDLSDDVFSEVLPPPSFNQPSSRIEDDEESLHRKELRLFLKGNSVCVFREYDQSLWEMNDEKGNGQTWRKLMTIPKFRNRDHHFQLGEFRIYHRLYPKCFTKSGKILFTVKSEKFVLFDPKEPNYEVFHVRGLEYGPFTKIVEYNESLISPDSIRGMNDID